MSAAHLSDIRDRDVSGPSTDAPFAYLRDPFCAELRGDPNDEPVAMTWRDGEFGEYDDDAQVWRYPDGLPSMGVWTKCNGSTSCSTPPTAHPWESTDWLADDSGWVTDDACA